MNWDAISAIGELLGSVTVVITLVYLAIQIKQSGKSAKSVSTNQSRAAVTDVLSAISSSTDAVRAYTSGMISDRESLELYERVRFDLIIFQQLRAVEIIFLEYTDDMVLQEVWLGQWRGLRSILRTKGGRASWNVQKRFVANSFMEWVDLHLDED